MSKTTLEKQTMLELVRDHPDLQPLLDEHLDDFHELLPHLLIADVCRWVLANYAGVPREVRRLLAWLEDHFETGGAERMRLDDLIAVSFIEHLPARWERDGEIVDELGPKMAAEYSRQWNE